MRLLDFLFDRPLVNVNLVKDNLDVAFQTANSLLREFEAAGLLSEITGGKRGRLFRYEPYLALLQDEAPARSGARELQATEPSVRGTSFAHDSTTPAR